MRNDCADSIAKLHKLIGIYDYFKNSLIDGLGGNGDFCRKILPQGVVNHTDFSYFCTNHAPNH